MEYRPVSASAPYDFGRTGATAAFQGGLRRRVDRYAGEEISVAIEPLYHRAGNGLQDGRDDRFESLNELRFRRRTGGSAGAALNGRHPRSLAWRSEGAASETPLYSDECRYGATLGRVTVKVAPWPLPGLCASMRPPCRWTSS